MNNRAMTVTTFLLGVTSTLCVISMMGQGEAEQAKRPKFVRSAEVSMEAYRRFENAESDERQDNIARLASSSVFLPQFVLHTIDPETGVHEASPNAANPFSDASYIALGMHKDQAIRTFYARRQPIQQIAVPAGGWVLVTTLSGEGMIVRQDGSVRVVQVPSEWSSSPVPINLLTGELHNGEALGRSMGSNAMPEFKKKDGETP